MSGSVVANSGGIGYPPPWEGETLSPIGYDRTPLGLQGLIGYLWEADSVVQDGRSLKPGGCRRWGAIGGGRVTDTSNMKPRGVVWDAKAKVWRARIMAEGVRTYLGSFATAEEAGEAYARVKASRRPVVAAERAPVGLRSVDRLAAFREQAERWHGEYKGRPEPTRYFVPGDPENELGDMLMVERDGQRFPQMYVFQRKTWRRFGGRLWALWEWSSFCAHPDCGEPFEVTTPGDVGRLTVPSAYCPAHRRPGRPRKAPRVLPQPEGGERASGGDPGGATGAFDGVMEGLQEVLQEALQEAARLAGIADLV